MRRVPGWISAILLVEKLKLWKQTGEMARRRPKASVATEADVALKQTLSTVVSIPSAGTELELRARFKTWSLDVQGFAQRGQRNEPCDAL